MKRNNKLAKLYLLVIIVPKGKKEVFLDMLEEYDVTASISTLARGTKDTLLTKEVMFCVVKDKYIKDVMFKVEDKISKFNKNVSMAYTIPLDAMVGISSYMALTNGGV